ncbi:MAG: hypothetical protein AAFV98_08710 [Chloroflexota bacterium]
MYKVLILIGVCFLWVLPMKAQDLDQEFTIECGNIVEGSFSADFELHRYTIELQPGDQVQVGATTIGEQLGVIIQLYGPTDNLIAQDFGSRTNGRAPTGNPSFESEVLSAPGEYEVRIMNYGFYGLNISGSSGLGVYNMFLGCELRDGTEITPGSVPIDQPEPTSQPVSTEVSQDETAPLFGFQGLSPIDFNNGVTLPLVIGEANTGNIAPGFDGIFGYQFNANSGDRLSLQYLRTSGNLPLGIAIINEENILAFQTSALTSDFLLTQFTTPTAGIYTIGVYRLAEYQPLDAQTTTFELTITTN